MTRIVDVPTGTQFDGPWPSREVAPPAGVVFDPLQIPSDAVALGDGTFSADGRWSPATGARSTLGNVAIRSELGRGSSRVLTGDRSSGRAAAVDLRDVASPEFIDVPTADQPSFFGTAESPDGRWLLLEHQDELHGWFDVVDLQATPPWQAHEIYRIEGAIKAAASAGPRAALSS